MGVNAYGRAESLAIRWRKIRDIACHPEECRSMLEETTMAAAERRDLGSLD